MGIVQGILEAISKGLFKIMQGLIWICDFCLKLFRKLVGLDEYYFDGVKTEGDIVEMLLQTDIVRNIFISLLVLGVILLLMTTFLAIWKKVENESPSKTINISLRALFNFIAVPVICLVGIFVGNALLRAIDGATGQKGEAGISGTIYSSMYSNALRGQHRFSGKNNAIIQANLKTYVVDVKGNIVDGKNTPDVDAGESLVSGIYTLFVDSNGEIDTDTILKYFEQNKKIDKSYRFFSASGYDLDVDGLNAQIQEGTLTFSYDNDDMLDVFFDYTRMNFLITGLILVILTKAMLSMTYALVKRLFYIVLLFIVSPPVVAMAPINDKALGNWRGLLVNNITTGYVTIALYNIFMSIFPIFRKITLFSKGSLGIENYVVSLLFVCVGLLTIDELSKALSKALGLGDLSPDDGWADWKKAFKRAGKTVGAPLKLPATVIGKGVQYANISKYAGGGKNGLNAVAEQLKKDAKEAGKRVSNIGPVGSFVEGFNTNSGIKKYKDDIKTIKTEKGVKDVKKSYNSTMKDISKQFNKAQSDLGYFGKNVEDRGNKKVIRNFYKDSRYNGYKQSLQTINDLSGIDASKMTDEQVASLREARSNLEALENQKVKIKRKETSLLHKFDLQNNFESTYENYHDLKKSSVTQLVNERNKVNMGEKRNAKAARAKDIIAENDAKQKVMGQDFVGDSEVSKKVDQKLEAVEKAQQDAIKAQKAEEERARKEKYENEQKAKQDKNLQKALEESIKTSKEVANEIKNINKRLDDMDK